MSTKRKEAPEVPSPEAWKILTCISDLGVTTSSVIKGHKRGIKPYKVDMLVKELLGAKLIDHTGFAGTREFYVTQRGLTFLRLLRTPQLLEFPPEPSAAQTLQFKPFLKEAA